VGHVRRYGWLGALLGLGAPLGYLALRRVTTPGGRGWVRRELRDRPLTYGYLTGATTAVFALFGAALGRREKQLDAVHERLDQLRDELAAVVAHDLRGPIQTLELQAQVLLRKASGGTVLATTRELERMHRAAMSLARMVADLLDATRVEAHRLSLEPRSLALPGAVGELVDRMRAQLGDHPIEVVLPASLPEVQADPQRLDQIVANLLENANKYSAPGTPIRVAGEARGDGVVLSVEDRGIGITPQEAARLFDRFYQARRARAAKSGLGLGLYITKGLVDAHGGRIWVESQPGRGSAFHVWLPARTRPLTDGPSRPRRPPPEGARRPHG
jgi:signal transduction histidine kinase